GSRRAPTSRHGAEVGAAAHQASKMKSGKNYTRHIQDGPSCKVSSASHDYSSGIADAQNVSVTVRGNNKRRPADEARPQRADLRTGKSSRMAAQSTSTPNKKTSSKKRRKHVKPEDDENENMNLSSGEQRPTVGGTKRRKADFPSSVNNPGSRSSGRHRSSSISIERRRASLVADAEPKEAAQRKRSTRRSVASSLSRSSRRSAKPERRTRVRPEVEEKQDEDACRTPSQQVQGELAPSSAGESPVAPNEGEPHVQ
ncbi:unnamed protein product, partial [Amoebophrya sp. A25]